MDRRVAAALAAALALVVASWAWLWQESRRAEAEASFGQSATANADVKAVIFGKTAISPSMRGSNGPAAPDIHAEVMQFRSRAASGDAEAAAQLAAAYDQCATFSASPADYARTTETFAALISDPGKRGIYEAHRSFVSEACRGFAQSGTRISPADVVKAVKAAAQMGSLAAEAELYGRQLLKSDQSDYESLLLERVLESNDPEAMLALSSSMGVGADVKFGDRYAGTQAHTYAWQLAACRRGLDCGPRSRLVTGYCVNGGICGGSFEQLLRNQLLPRDEYERVNRLAHIIQRELTHKSVI